MYNSQNSPLYLLILHMRSASGVRMYERDNLELFLARYGAPLASSATIGPQNVQRLNLDNVLYALFSDLRSFVSITLGYQDTRNKCIITSSYTAVTGHIPSYAYGSSCKQQQERC